MVKFKALLTRGFMRNHGDEKMNNDFKDDALNRMAKAMNSYRSEEPVTFSSRPEVTEHMQKAQAIHLAAMFQDWKTLVFGCLVLNRKSDDEAHWARYQPTAPGILADDYEARAIEVFTDSSLALMDRLQAVDLLMRAEALRQSSKT